MFGFRWTVYLHYNVQSPPRCALYSNYSLTSRSCPCSIHSDKSSELVLCAGYKLCLVAAETSVCSYCIVIVSSSTVNSLGPLDTYLVYTTQQQRDDTKYSGSHKTGLPMVDYTCNRISLFRLKNYRWSYWNCNQENMWIHWQILAYFKFFAFCIKVGLKS